MSGRRRKSRLSPIVCALIVAVCLVNWGIDKYKEHTAGENRTQAVTEQNDDSGFLVHYIDVGQGDSTLIETDSGKFVLIDAGTNSCEHELLSYLDSRNVEYIEYLVLTHPHEDHIGSADAVLDSYYVKNVVKNDKDEDNATCERLNASLDESIKQIGTKVIVPDTGYRFSVDDIEFLVLSDGKEYDDVNDSSLCLRMECGNSTFIFTGDAQKKVEYDIIDGDYDISAEVLKCGHHGSSTSNCDAFINDVNPDIAIISCESGNMYGHPHSEVMESLFDRNITVYRTDIDSTVVLDCDANTIKYVEPQSQP